MELYKSIIAMVHTGALPGTPENKLGTEEIAANAVNDARVLVKEGVDILMIENMHGRPYLNRTAGPEIIAYVCKNCAGAEGIRGMGKLCRQAEGERIYGLYSKT